MIVLDCPVPPSVNRLWRMATTNRGRMVWYKTRHWDVWLKEAWACWLLIKPADFKRIESDVTIEILIAPDRKRDADNSSKAVCDMLENIGILVNDSQAKEVMQRLVDKVEAPAGCRITVREI
jgi:Holliday junction resolvase RusA-like endonuclease